MIDSAISWTDDTSNPWWGCQKVSDGCKYCYAEALDARFRPGGTTHWGPSAPRLLRLDAFGRELEAIARKGEREGRLRRVFVASMCDVCEDRPDLVEPRKRVWDILHRLGGETPRLVPMILTKHPDVMAAVAKEHGWPAAAWAGTTVEDQENAAVRIPCLLRVDAPVRFVSCEPLLGPVDLTSRREAGGTGGRVRGESAGHLQDRARRTMGLHFVIAGGESGSKARPSHPDWFRSLRDQAKKAGAAFHFKQWGAWALKGVAPEVKITRASDFGVMAPDGRWYPGDTGWNGRADDPDTREAYMRRVGVKAAGRLLDGRTWDEVPEVTP